ncbi:MAG: carboxypeptidase-like regulatory domain-containing protein [Bauldia sp.]
MTPADHCRGEGRRGTGAPLLLTATAALFLAACSPTPTMTGEVRDNFGNPLPGVAVTVDKTSFAATTDEKGRYTVQFNPGAVNVRFVKDGYAEGHFGVRLPQKKPQKIDVVTLQKIPPGPGLWLVAGGVYTPAARCDLKLDSQTTGRRPTVVTALGEPIAVNGGVAPPHFVTFVDNHPWTGGPSAVPLIFKVTGGENEIFRSETVGANSVLTVEQARLEDTTKPDAFTGKWFAARLGDGTYVYAARGLIAGIGFGPDAKNACFKFRVGGPT